MTDDKPPRTPFAHALKHIPDDELALRPDSDGIEVCLGLGVTTEREARPIVRLVFTDPYAGHVSVDLDPHAGHAERIHGQLHRLLSAVHFPDQHPEDAAEVEQMLDTMARNLGLQP